MFEAVRIKTEVHLQLLLAESKSALLKSIQKVNYPLSLNNKNAIEKWDEIYREVDALNNKLLGSINNKAGVYALYMRKGDSQCELLYIGQTQSKTSKQRIRSHIVWRNKTTKSGKITGSKFDEVQKVIMSGNDLLFSFVEIQPASLRHYIEEKIIGESNPPWNKHKNNKKCKMSCGAR